MKMKTCLIFSAASAAALLVFANVHAATAPAPAAAPPANAPKPGATNTNPEAAMAALFGDPVIVKGKGIEVKRSELDQVMTGIKSSAMARNQPIPKPQLDLIEKQIMDRLIQIQILLTKATSDDKAAGKKKADEQIAALLERAGSQAVLDRQLKAAGISADDFRGRITQETTAQAVLDRELKITASDADAKKFYDGHTAEFEQPEQVTVRHILLMTIDPATRTPLPTEQQQAKRKQMDDLLKRVRAGEDFAKLATQYSEDPGSKEKGGELPAFGRGQMVPEFESAAFTLNTNQISDVITTMYGYHIIKLLGKTPAQKVAYGKVAPNIKQYLLLQEEQKQAPAYLEKLKKEYNVEILDPDLRALEAATNAPTAGLGGN